MIFDSDVVIHALRGVHSAAQTIHQAPQRGISTVTRLEVLQGAADKRRQRLALKMLTEFRFEEFPLTPTIGTKAAELLQIHALGDGLRLADALIAATAIGAGVPLVTGNDKHFRKLDGLDVQAFRV